MSTCYLKLKVVAKPINIPISKYWWPCNSLVTTHYQIYDQTKFHMVKGMFLPKHQFLFLPFNYTNTLFTLYKLISPLFSMLLFQLTPFNTWFTGTCLMSPLGLKEDRSIDRIVFCLINIRIISVKIGMFFQERITCTR